MLKSSNEDIILDSISNKMSINILLDDKEVYDMLFNKNGNEKIDLVKRSIKIGMIALKNAVITVDTRYVERELERLTAVLDDNLRQNLGKEGMKGELDRTFGKNGILELNLKEMFKNHETIINDILSENNINSPLNKIRKYIEDNSRVMDKTMYSLLDPGNRDSLTFRLKDDIIKKIEDIRRSDTLEIININQSLESIKNNNINDKEHIREEIQRFKEDVDNKFIDMKKSFYDEIGHVKNVTIDTNTELAKIVKEKKVVDQTTLKGFSFDNILYQFLATRAISKYGDTVDIINLSGGDKAGDLVINVKGCKDKIIIKAESTSIDNVQTPDTILKYLNITMKSRDTDYGIKVYENELPENIGPILINDNKIICSFLRGYSLEGFPLEVAYEILRSNIIRSHLGINSQDIREHIDNIVRLMDSYQTIIGNLSKMENLCINTKSHVESLRKNIFTELDLIVDKSEKKSSEVKDDIGVGKEVKDDIGVGKEVKDDIGVGKEEKVKEDKIIDKNIDNKIDSPKKKRTPTKKSRDKDINKKI